VLGTMVISTGEAISVGVSVGVLVATSVWVALTGKVVVATAPTGFWPVICPGELAWPDRLQAVRTATSAREIDRNLNGFNFGSMIEMSI